ELAFRFGDQGPHVGGAGYIFVKHDCPASQGSHGCGDCMRFVCQNVVDDDICTAFGHEKRMGLAHTAPRSGDPGDFTVQTVAVVSCCHGIDPQYPTMTSPPLGLST